MISNIKHYLHVVCDNGWGGSRWEIVENGQKVELSRNFYAKEYPSMRDVIIISHPETIRDHGASWEVFTAKVYDKNTLEELTFYKENDKYVKWSHKNNTKLSYLIEI